MLAKLKGLFQRSGAVTPSTDDVDARLDAIDAKLRRLLPPEDVELLDACDVLLTGTVVSAQRVLKVVSDAIESGQRKIPVTKFQEVLRK